MITFDLFKIKNIVLDEAKSRKTYPSPNRLFVGYTAKCNGGVKLINGAPLVKKNVKP